MKQTNQMWELLDELDNFCVSLQEIDRLKICSIDTANRAIRKMNDYIRECNDKDWLRAVFVIVFSESIYFISSTQQLSLEREVLNKLHKLTLSKDDKKKLLQEVRTKAIAMHGDNNIDRVIDISLHCREVLFLPPLLVCKLNKRIKSGVDKGGNK